MAPQPLTGRYKLYKAGTAKLVDWLASTASRCCDVRTIIKSLSGSMAVKPPKKSKGPEAVELSTQDLIKLAEAIISAKPPADIPESIIKIIENVISGRRECAAWYAGQALEEGSDVQRQNETHRYFITILERILYLLADARNNMGTAAKTTSSNVTGKKTGKKEAKQHAPVTREEELINMFLGLEVEEPSEIHIEPPTSGASPLIKVVSFKLQKKQDDAAFQVWCFLQDLTDVREYVKKTWLEYVQGQISFLVASSVTDTAFGLLRCADEEFAETSPFEESGIAALEDFFGLTSFPQGNVIWLCPCKHSTHPKDRHSSVNVVELLCPIARHVLLEYVCDMAAHCKVAHAGRNGGKVEEPEPQGSYHWHDFGQVLLALTPQLDEITHGSSCHHIVLDEFVQGLVECHNKHRRVPVWVVHACQIYLDTYDLLGDHVKHGADAIKAALSKYNQVVANLREYSSRYDDKLDDVRHGIHRLTLVVKAANRFNYQHHPNHRADSRKDDDAIFSHAACKDGCCAKTLLDDGDFTQLELDATMMEHLLPAHAGAVLVDWAVAMHQAGCILANHDCIVLSAAHLYKYLRAAGLVNTDWHDMDFVLSSSKQPLVTKLRSGLDSRAASRHFLMALGAPASDFDEYNPKPSAERAPVNAPRKIEVKSELLQAIGDRKTSSKRIGHHHTKAKTVECVLHALSALSRPSTEGGKQTTQENFTPVKLLETFKKSLQAVEPQMSFNYISFMMSCTELLVTIFDKSCAFLPKLQHIPRHGDPHVNLTFITDRLLRCSATDPFLLAAAQAINDHITATGRTFSKQAFDQSSGRIPKALRPQIEERMAVYDPDREMTSLVLESADTKYTFSGNSLSAYHPEILSECSDPNCPHAALRGDESETDPTSLVHQGKMPVVAFGSAIPQGIVEACKGAIKEDPDKWFKAIREVCEKMEVRYDEGELPREKILSTLGTMVDLFGHESHELEAAISNSLLDAVLDSADDDDGSEDGEDVD